MRPILQPDPERGCFRASLASIAEVPLYTLPELTDTFGRLDTLNAAWFECWRAWLSPRNVGLICVGALPGYEPPGYAICTLVRYVRRAPQYHSLVSHNGRIVHDPIGEHSTWTRKEQRLNYIVVTLLDPSRPHRLRSLPR
jgi:hypothetical protein